MAKHPWLLNRDGRYYLRARVPADLVDSIGRREIKRSLRTSDAKEASRRLRTEAADVERLFERARQGGGDGTPAGSLTERDIGQAVRDWLGRRERAEAKRRWTGRDATTRDPREILLDLNSDEAALLDVDDPVRAAVVQGAANRLLADQNAQLTPGTAAYGMLCELVARALLEQTRRARARLAGDHAERCFDRFFLDTNQDRHDGPGPAGETTRIGPDLVLEDLIGRFCADPASDREDKTRADYAMLFRLLSEVWGPDKRVAEIAREDCRSVRDILTTLPPNARKRFKGLTLVEASTRARAEGLQPIDPVTANNYLGKLSTLLRWAEREDYIERNPALGLRIASSAANKRDARRPFSIGQLQKIFAAPLYIGCVDDESGYANPGPNHPRRARFWLPLISLFHGLRLNEGCQLLTSDIVMRDGVDVILVRPDGEGKKLKTAAAQRVVPIHPDLTKIRFLDYVAAQRHVGAVRLFPELKRDGRGYYSDGFQKWFARFLLSCDAKEDKTSFHSFRHNFRDALREAGVSRDAVRALGGWAASGTEEVYGDGLRASTLSEEISKVRYQGLDLSLLHTA